MPRAIRPVTGPSLRAVAGLALLLAGCSATEVPVVEVDDVDQASVQVPGQSRVVYRTGERELAQSFELRSGTATWTSSRFPTERTAPASRLAAVQIHARSPHVKLGLAMGFLAGAAVGGSLNSDSSFISDTAAATAMGILGGAIGALLGLRWNTWKDRYVFGPEPGADAPADSPPREP